MRLSELKAHCVHPASLSRLVHDGTVVRTSRCLYEFADTEVNIAHSLAKLAKRVPKGVIRLVSALPNRITWTLDRERGLPGRG